MEEERIILQIKITESKIGSPIEFEFNFNGSADEVVSSIAAASGSVIASCLNTMPDLEYNEIVEAFRVQFLENLNKAMNNKLFTGESYGRNPA